ncbi:MAG: glycosyltransferase family 4 protein [Bacteroidetes bacterium]|nr:glycosyltransferase family 4 protein [Bacteroidota bacterium]
MTTNIICFFNSSKKWGGGEKWHYDNATFLAKKGYQVVVFTNTKSELADELKKSALVKCIQLKVSNFSFLNPLRIIQLNHYLKKINPKTVIVNLPSDLKLIGISTYLYKSQKIIYRRGSAIPIKNSFLNRFLFKKVISGVIANSEATKKTILENNPKLFPQDKIEVIYNGIEINTIDNDLEKNHNEIILGHIGRFSKEKNQRFLILVAQELIKKGIPFKMILGGDGNDFREIKDFVSKANLEDKIILPGFINNNDNFLKSIDIFLLPSIWEGFGYVTVEAMAYKKPVIAFNVGSNPEIIQDENTGFLVTPFELDQFVDKIIFLFENPQKISEFGSNGRKRAIEYFDVRNSFEQLENYLK